MWIRGWLAVVFVFWGHANAQGELELTKQVSIDGGPYFDVNNPMDAPEAGVDDVVTYQFTVTNVGAEVLFDGVLEDSTLGLIDEFAALLPGEELVYVAMANDICTEEGIVTNVATVTASTIAGHQFSVSDPAYVFCNVVAPCMLEVKKTCQAVLGDGAATGDNVKYIYEIANTGSVDIDSLSIVDDQLGQLNGPSSIAVGATVTIEVLTRIDETTINTVTVTGNSNDGECMATDTAEAVVCSNCEKRLNELTLQYNGASSPATVMVEEDGSVFTVQPGDEFTVQRKKGSKITLFVNGVKDADIKLKCKDGIGPGIMVGSFRVVSGTSNAPFQLCPNDSSNQAADSCVVPELEMSKNDSKSKSDSKSSSRSKSSSDSNSSKSDSKSSSDSNSKHS